MRHVIALAALSLAACAGAPDASAPDELRLRGTEPFWAMQIRGRELTLQRPDHPDLKVQAQVSRSGAMTRWTGVLPDGRTLAAQTQAGDCSDGMSDLRYPLTAEVRLGDGVVLKGCGGQAATPAQP